MKKLVAASVISLAALLGAGAARADEPPPPPAVSATPLAPRPQKALALAPTTESTPIGYKLFVGAALALAGGLWIRNKRKKQGDGKTKAAKIDVVGRTSVGVRSELIVVDVEGTRLLVGMTPNAIQTLAVLDTPDSNTEMNEPEEEVAAPAPRRSALAGLVSEPPAAMPRTRRSEPRGAGREQPDEVSDRVRTLLAARGQVPAKAPAAPVTARRLTAAASAAPMKSSRIAGQAKGLLMSFDEPEPRRGDW